MTENPSNQLQKIRSLLVAEPISQVMAANQTVENRMLALLQNLESKVAADSAKQALSHKRDTDNLIDLFENRLAELKKTAEQNQENAQKMQDQAINRSQDQLRKEFSQEINILIDAQNETRQDFFYLKEKYTSTVAQMEDAWGKADHEIKQILNTEVQRILEMRQILNTEMQRLRDIEQRINLTIQQQDGQQDSRRADMRDEIESTLHQIRRDHAAAFGETNNQVKKLQKLQENIRKNLALSKADRQELAIMFSNVASRLDLDVSSTQSPQKPTHE